MEIELKLPSWAEQCLTQELGLEAEQIKPQCELWLAQIIRNQVMERWKQELTWDAGRAMESKAEALFGKKPGSKKDVNGKSSDGGESAEPKPAE